MMYRKKLLLTLSLFSLSSLWAVEIHPVHSSIEGYYEFKIFTGSKQKTDGRVLGIGADIHNGRSEYRFAYEKGFTNTLQPPLDKDLKTDKLFLKYAYRFDEAWEGQVHYINILNDNIAITDGGAVYGLGLNKVFSKKLNGDFTQYFTHYNDFNVYQSDLRLSYSTRIQDVKVKFSSLTKYISIDTLHANSFTKNAQDEYLTTSLQIQAHYNTYHLAGVAYIGERLFAVMNDGFKIQHHSMEFKKTYAVSAGKRIGNMVVRLQYIYQEATELPLSNENVKLRNTRVLLNYKF